MGWLFISNRSRQDIVDEIVRFKKTSMVYGKPCVIVYEVMCCGALLSGPIKVKWTNKKTGDVKKVITCHLLEKCDGDWGYKSMDESMGPYYYTCPVSYLKEVPVANQGWRNQVLEQHQRSNRRRNFKIQVGDKLILAGGLKIPSVTVVEMRPGRQLIGCYAGEYYRIKRAYIKSVEHPQEVEAA